MKKILLFCTKIWPFLGVLPPLMIMAFSIYYNPMMNTPGKLYPLTIFCILCCVFIFLYFFRVIIISTEEIQSAGVFSSKDHAIIEKDRTLVFTLLDKGEIRVELNGKSEMPGFHWAKEEDYLPLDINLYRARAVGGANEVRRVLRCFSVSEADISSLLSEDSFVREYDGFTVSSSKEEKRVIQIKFTKTI